MLARVLKILDRWILWSVHARLEDNLALARAMSTHLEALNKQGIKVDPATHHQPLDDTATLAVEPVIFLPQGCKAYPWVEIWLLNRRLDRKSASGGNPTNLQSHG